MRLARRRLSVTVTQVPASRSRLNAPIRDRRKIVICPECSRRHATRAAGLLAVFALAIGVSACGGSSGGSTGGSASKTAAAKQSRPAKTASSSASAPASTSASATSAAAASGSGASASKSNATTTVPDYKPSSIVSKHGGSTVLSSPDPVAKVGAYYKGALAKGGWQVRSAVVTAASASFSAHRAGEGVTISVYPNASGSGISITTYPG
jgi:hypothetical protein